MRVLILGFEGGTSASLIAGFGGMTSPLAVTFLLAVGLIIGYILGHWSSDEDW